MRLPKDILTGTMTKPRLFLCETNKAKICQLETIEMSGSFKFNAYSELTFTVGRTYTNITTGKTYVNPYYNKIEALRLVYLEGFGYFEIQDPEIVSDGIKEIKNVTAYSLEYTLSQKYLEGFNINTGKADSLEVIEANGGKIEPISLYNEENERLSLLNIILEKIYGWKIGHVDNSLKTMGRTFEISRVSVYDFIIQDICDKFNCFAVFDTEKNTINIYAESLITKHVGNGSDKSFTVSPAYDTIGSVSIDSYKTTAYTYEIKIVNGVKVGTITFSNAPSNGSKIEITDGSQAKWTTDVYVTFDNLAQEVNVSYSADDIKTVLTVKGAENLDIREVNMGLPYIVDLSYYYNVDWMGQDLYDTYTEYVKQSNKNKEIYTPNVKNMLKLRSDITYEQERLSLEYSIAENVTSTTVGTYFVRGGEYPNYYYTEVNLPDEYNANIEHYYMLSGTDLNEDKFGELYSALQIYFISVDKKDVSEIDKLVESFAFMENNKLEDLSKALSDAATLEQKNKAILLFFDEMWEQLGRTPLESLYYKPYKKKEEVNIEAGWNEESNDNYWNYYPVTLVLSSLETEMNQRDEKIKEYEDSYKKLEEKNQDIARSMSIYNYFTHDQLVRLNSFLREDEYTDDNFIETSIDTVDTTMQTKQELLECGYIELSKLCEPKLAFSMDMANIYALPEFEPIIDQFQLGNLINVAIRSDYIKRARLLAVEINFNDFSDFSCEFGELTNFRTPSSIHADLLASALSAGKTVASSASYWDKSYDTTTTLRELINQGLLDAGISIKAIDGNQGVEIDKYGIHLRKYDETTGELDPKEGWIVNNQILYSDNNFSEDSPVKAVFGEYVIDGKTKWGVLCEAVMSGYIAGCTIEGGTIDIGEGTFKVDQFGHVTMKASSIDGYVEENNVISSINQSAEKIAINANKISLAGKKIDLTSDNITIDSTNFSVTKDGKIIAKSGEIAGWTIYDNLLRKETTKDGISYQMYMQAADGTDSKNAFAVRKRGANETDWDVQFAVNYAGKMTAKNAHITGTIVAQDGTIAGYNIGPGGSYDDAIYKRVTDGTTSYEVGMKATDKNTDLAFYVKESTDNWSSSSNTFYIRNNGQLYAQNANIKGKIIASSGELGSWIVGDMGNYSDSIYATYCAASTPSSSNPEYAVFMRGKGSSATTIAIGVKKRTSSSTSWNDADNPFYVRKDGYVHMTNANVTGEITATSGAIDGNLEISGSLTHTRGNYKVTIRGVQGDVSNGVFYITDSSSGSNEYPVRINGDGSARFTNVTITGDSTISAACIGNLNASKITAGTFSADRIPNLSASKITSGTISTDRLSASVITTGNFSSKSLSTGNLTVSNGAKIGNWSVSSGNLYAISGNVGTSLTAYGVSTGSTGSISASWTNIAMAGQNASDKRLKKDICELDSKYDYIFNNLKPVQFRYTNDFYGSGQHFGFIAQDVIKTMNNNDVVDFAGIYEDSSSGISYYQLQKQEFIALNTWQIQKLKQRVEELENKLYELERNDTK